MTYRKHHVRSGLTAIAAVLALSSTPLAAQEVNTPPDIATETPSESAPAADPLAPEPAASEPVASEPEALEPDPVATAAPAATRRAPTRSQSQATNRAASQPTRTTAVAAPAPAGEGPAEAMPVPPAPLDPMAAPVAEPPVAEAAPSAEPVPGFDDLLTEDSLPYAGAAGIGLLALAGAGLVARRRKRRRELEHYAANQHYLDEHPVEPEVVHEPAFVRAAPAVPITASALPEAEVRTDVPRTRLPNGFDLSRFGPHVRAAYMGPTPDNPSLSLKYRLRRAAALDQRARLEAEHRPPVELPAKRPEPTIKPVWASDDAGFMFRKAGASQPSRSRVQ